MVRRCVRYRNLVNEEALAHCGLLGQKKKTVITLTDKHKCADLMYWFMFSTATCFGCLHRPSSGRHRFTETIKKGGVSPNKQRCKIVQNSANCYTDGGIATLKVVSEACLVQSNVSDGTYSYNVT